MRSVTVYIGTTKGGRVRLSTEHLEDDGPLVKRALTMAGVGAEPTKEPTEWNAKRREAYIEALKKCGLAVKVEDRRQKKSSK